MQTKRQRTQIIAELCQNHNGDIELLKEMVRSAAQNGADYVKGQIIFSDNVTYRERFEDGEVLSNGVVKTITRPYQAEVSRLMGLDLAPFEMRGFVQICIDHGVKPLMTVFTREDIAFAKSLPLPESVVKVASPDVISIPFLKELADAFDHIILSTGGATDEEIAVAAATIHNKGKQLTLMHCVSLYPNPLNLCNLARMDYLRNLAHSVGWSDHTNVEVDGIKASKVASMLGADFIERHFTILPADQSKDGIVSVTPELLKELVGFTELSQNTQRITVNSDVPEWETLVGMERRELTHAEILNIDYMRGRFASLDGENGWIYNWEDTPLPAFRNESE